MQKAYVGTQNDSSGGNTDLSPPRILKLTRQVAAADVGRMMSTIVLFFTAHAKQLSGGVTVAGNSISSQPGNDANAQRSATTYEMLDEHRHAPAPVYQPLGGRPATARGDQLDGDYYNAALDNHSPHDDNHDDPGYEQIADTYSQL